MDRQWTRTKRRSGFTLVELMIVLVIVAVVGAIALPRYSQASARQQLSSAANRVTADIELARTRSRAASQPVRLTFSTENNTYSFDNIGGEAIRVDLSASPYNVSIEVAKFGADSNVALFNGYGVPANSGVVTLSNHTGTVSVNMLGNGEVRR